VHGAVFTLGAYVFYLFFIQCGFPVYISLISSFLLLLILVGSIEVFVYRPLRRSNSSSLVLLLVSLGLYILIQNVISIIWSDETIITNFVDMNRILHLGGARLTTIQGLSILLSFFVLALLILLKRTTKIGREIQAISANVELASVCGISPDKVVLFVMALGSCIAALGGILQSLDTGLRPTMGMYPLLIAVVATIIGGSDNLWGVTLGVLLLTIIQHLTIWMIGSTWQEPSVFITLIIFLLLKPEGFFGKKIKTSTV
jgi:branched-chain amino acid transport system permease protein